MICLHTILKANIIGKKCLKNIEKSFYYVCQGLATLDDRQTVFFVSLYIKLLQK